MRKGVEVRLGPGDRERLEAIVGRGSSSQKHVPEGAGGPQKAVLSPYLQNTLRSAFEEFSCTVQHPHLLPASHAAQGAFSDHEYTPVQCNRNDAENDRPRKLLPFVLSL